ncbi:BSD domain-containing protein 1-like isoform X1 [Argonauta hians]
MAESEPDTINSWFGGWIQSAKEKSSSAFEFVKRDLAEFTTVIQSDTSKAVSMTRSTISENLKAENAVVAKSKVQESFNHFLHGISKALEVVESPESPSGTESAKTAVYDRAQARLHAIQVDPGTYCNPPASGDKFANWLKTFELENEKGSISELLVSNASIRALYTNLVPTTVSHTEFWHRYFYKIHQLQQDEARKLALMKRAEQTKDDSFSWDEDEDWSADEETEVIKHSTLAELVGIAEEDNNGNTEHIEETKQEVTPPVVEPEQKRHIEENTVFRKAVTVEEEMGATRTVPEEEEVVSPMQQSIAELQVQSEGLSTSLLPSSSTNSNDALDQLEDILTTSTFVNSDVSVNDSLSVMKPLTEVTESNILPLEGTNGQSNQPDNGKHISLTEVTNSKESEEVFKTQHNNNNIIPETTNCEWKNLFESPVSSLSDSFNKSKELKTTCKGDMVVVGSLAGSPSSDASDLIKDTASSCPDDEWEQDFSVDVTEEDLRKAQEALKKLSTTPLQEVYKTTGDVEDEDWESWE